jgi:hypothetical protein
MTTSSANVIGMSWSASFFCIGILDLQRRVFFGWRPIMSESTLQCRSGSTLREVASRHLPESGGDPSLAGALKVMVRRILRTQDGRAGFPARVLEQAKLLRDRHGRELERETFESLLVNQLLGARQDRHQLAPVGATPVCPSTWGRIFEATFRGAAASPGRDSPCEKNNRKQLHR